MLANEPNRLYRQVEAVFLAAGGEASDGVAQVTDKSGVLVTAFENPGQSGLEEAREQPSATHGDARALNQEEATVCWVECGSEHVFVCWARRVAARREAPLWVLDGDAVLWSIDVLDESAIVL